MEKNPFKKQCFPEYFKSIQTEITSWTAEVLNERCRTIGIKGGTVNERRGRLKKDYKKFAKLIYSKMSCYPPGLYSSFSYFEYLVVIDFEATCDYDPPANFRHEIIQFPAVLVNVRNKVIVDEFCIYVKPTINPKLTPFCTKLTGITQDQVNNAPEFKQALRLFENWLAAHKLGTTYRYAIVCDGQYDMGKFLYTQCEISGIPYFPSALYWVNLRVSFKYFYHVTWINLKMVLDLIGQPFQGRPHNGLDDARNIATVLIRLLHDGCTIMQNEQILLKKEDQEKNAYLQGKSKTLYALSTVQKLTRRDFLAHYHCLNMNIVRESQKASQPMVKVDQSNKENMISNDSARSRNNKKKNGKVRWKQMDQSTMDGNRTKITQEE